ncbi:hypothetical protein Ddye_025429 [Dipteronia dyeriana]|uniref:N-acetyltransferase domain-containing protein n=1 Tax=Dipteronia dyeriana TaxID=168575 RepID=A0AAD9WN79_9ROSI|nr:hypothetical protein Ddye_025429 [Dipteronia dyeriana]
MTVRSDSSGSNPGSGDDRCRADIGYALAVEFWGQGVATKAVKLAINEALKNFPEVVMNIVTKGWDLPVVFCIVKSY